MRAIDGDSLKREIVDFKVNLCPENRDYGTGYFSALSVVEGMLACAPTLTLDDLRPKGRWELADDGDGVVCSECGTDFCSLVYATDDFHFCPSCGADMREGGEDG